MAVRAITFDFWCTLFRDAEKEERQQLRIEALHELSGVSRQAIDEALDIVWQEFSRHHIEEQQTPLPEDAVRMAARELGISLAGDEAERLAGVFATAILTHSPVPIEGALEAVKRAAGNVPIGLISDTGVSPGSSLKVLMDRHGFTPYFTTFVFSDEAGVSKPRQEIFEAAARGLSVKPHELLHIGDLELTDIAGARAVGAKAALFTGENARYADATAADYVFSRWDDFVGRLPEICNHRGG